MLANLDELKYVIHYLRTLSKTDGFTQSNAEMISSLCFEVVGAVLVWLLFCDFIYSCLQKGMLVGYTLRVSKYSELHGLAMLLINKPLKTQLQHFLLELSFMIIHTHFSRRESDLNKYYQSYRSCIYSHEGKLPTGNNKVNVCNLAGADL